MAIDFEEWNQKFGGEEAVKAVKEAKEHAGEYSELPDGKYVCKLEKLELGEYNGAPVVNGTFRIIQGEHKKQCIFYNGYMSAKDASKNGFVQHRVLEFLRSLQVLDDIDVDFDGNFAHFNDLLLDIAEAAEEDGLKFEVKKSTNSRGYKEVKIEDTFE